MNLDLTIPFPSPELATLAFEVLNVDRELKGSGVTRKISTSGNDLSVIFNGDDLKRLRVSVNSFIKNVVLIVKTLDQFKS